MLQRVSALPKLGDPALVRAQAYIDGAWCDGAHGKFDVSNPADGGLLVEVANCGAADAQRAVPGGRRFDLRDAGQVPNLGRQVLESRREPEVEGPGPRPRGARPPGSEEHHRREGDRPRPGPAEVASVHRPAPLVAVHRRPQQALRLRGGHRRARPAAQVHGPGRRLDGGGAPGEGRQIVGEDREAAKGQVKRERGLAEPGGAGDRDRPAVPLQGSGVQQESIAQGSRQLLENEVVDLPHGEPAVQGACPAGTADRGGSAGSHGHLERAHRARGGRRRGASPEPPEQGDRLVVVRPHARQVPEPSELDRARFGGSHRRKSLSDGRRGLQSRTRGRKPQRAPSPDRTTLIVLRTIQRSNSGLRCLT